MAFFPTVAESRFAKEDWKVEWYVALSDDEDGDAKRKARSRAGMIAANNSGVMKQARDKLRPAVRVDPTKPLSPEFVEPDED
jgi:hypothetical protein